MKVTPDVVAVHAAQNAAREQHMSLVLVGRVQFVAMVQSLGIVAEVQNSSDFLYATVVS